MNIQEQRQGAVVVLRPTGPLAQADADAFKARAIEIRRESMGRLVVDAAAVPFIDSRGLEALVELHEELLESGQSLKVCGLNETVREALDLTEVASVVEQFADAGDAVRSFL